MRLPTGSRPRAQGLVEFALVIPIVILLIVVVFDFGRAVFGISSLGNAARLGARTAIVNQFAQDVRSKAASQALVLGLDSTGTGCPTLAGQQTGVCLQVLSPDLSTTCSPPDLGCVAVVTTKWTFRPITPVIGQLIGTLTFTSVSKEPIESVCTNAAPACPVP